MKKSLFFLAFGAILLAMASCGTPEVKLKNFNIEVFDVDEYTANIEITPKTETTNYKWYLEYKETFLQAPENYKESKKPLQNAQGTVHDKLYLTPGTAYVLYAFEIDENGTAKGDIEYVSFTTENIPDDLEPGLSLTFDGTVGPSLGGGVLLDLTNNDGTVMSKILSKKQSYVGEYTTKELARSYGFMDSGLEVKDDPSDENGEYLYIFRINIIGTYLAADDIYQYTGWVDACNAEKQMKAQRISIEATCTEKQ